MRLFLLCIIVAIVHGYTNVHYGDKGLHIVVNSKSQWLLVETILKEHMKVEDIDVWKFPDNKGNAYINVIKDAFDGVINDLDSEGIPYDVIVDDVGILIDEVDENLAVWNEQRGDEKSVVGTYARYDEILAWFDTIVADFPELATTIDIGTTYEGRPHRILKLSTGASPSKWNVYVEGGMHAREWIAPATAIYILDQIVQGYANGDTEILQWFDLLDWYFLPVANPDGYEYCHTNERLWRKSRSPNDGSSCIGTDLNRNWAYEWGGVGGDTDPCSNTYRGTGPESEIEVQNVVNFIMPQAETFILYMAYHCWGQQFFTRWDYAEDGTVPADHEELLDLAQRAVDAIVGVNDVFYEAGTAPNIMYAFSGSSADWARGVADIKYPYLEELRDDGNYSFVLPPEQIIPTGSENWAGFQVVIREINEKCTGVAPPGPCNP